MTEPSAAGMGNRPRFDPGSRLKQAKWKQNSKRVLTSTVVSFKFMGVEYGESTADLRVREHKSCTVPIPSHPEAQFPIRFFRTRPCSSVPSSSLSHARPRGNALTSTSSHIRWRYTHKRTPRMHQRTWTDAARLTERCMRASDVRCNYSTLNSMDWSDSTCALVLVHLYSTHT